MFPPVVHDPAWSDPVPMAGPVNTAGGEDSPFIAPDGSMFLFWFTPDVSIPAEQQVNDVVTGIWYASPGARGWDEPTFVELSGSNSLEGCPTLLGKDRWFCSIRAGNYGEHEDGHGGSDIWMSRLGYHGPAVFRSLRDGRGGALPRRSSPTTLRSPVWMRPGTSTSPTTSWTPASR